MPLDGQQLGRYLLLHPLGGGGMGEVYLAEDTHIHRQVAIKVIRAEATPYPNSTAAKEAGRLFQREIRAIALLDHPHILPLYDYGEVNMQDNVLTYMVMPYRSEGSLSTWLRQHSGPELLSPQDVVFFIRQAASALYYAHQHQIIHQDVKPSNFLIRHNEENPNRPDLLLADFGIAKFTSASSSMSQTTRGTPVYMAPEQWTGQPVPACDQYALAITAYQLLTGNPPFRGRQEQVMYQHLNIQPQPPSTLNPQIPADLDSVILHALAKKPEERFASIAAFARAFQQSLQNTRDIHAILAISTTEAQNGSSRVLTLPDGRQTRVFVPADARDGQIIRVENPSRALSEGDTGGALVLTLAITPAKGTVTLPHASSDATMRSSIPPSMPATKEIKQTTPVLPPTVPTPSPSTSLANAAPVSHIGSRAAIHRLLNLSRTRAIVLIVLALLLVGGLIGGGTFYFHSYNYFQRVNLLHASIPDPYSPTIQTLAVNDPLSENSNGYFWGEASDDSSACTFTERAFHINISKQDASHACTAGTTNFGNFAYEMQMKIVQGDQGGIIFRSDEAGANCYYFKIGQDGSYELDLYMNNAFSQALKSGTNPAIKTGLNQTNTIAVVASGSNFNLYVNNQQIDSVSDSTLSQGEIGVAAFEASNPTEVAFNNARVWTF